MVSYTLDGSVLEAVGLDNRGYLYGDGFFTTIRVLAGKPQLWQYHLQRLLDCAQALHFSVDVHAVQSAVISHATSLAHGIVKVQVSRLHVAGKRGYAPTSDNVQVVITVHELSDMSFSNADSQQSFLIQRPIDVAFLSQRIALQPENLAGLKSLSRIENVLAAHELLRINESRIQQSQLQVADGIVCTVNDYVVEGISSNLFFYYDNQWMTPSLCHAGVAGTCRQAILDATDIVIADLPLANLSDIEAAFLCNAVRGMQPIKAIYDDKQQQYVVQKLNTQVVEQLHGALCDNVAFMAHVT